MSLLAPKAIRLSAAQWEHLEVMAKFWSPDPGEGEPMTATEYLRRLIDRDMENIPP